MSDKHVKYADFPIPELSQAANIFAKAVGIQLARQFVSSQYVTPECPSPQHDSQDPQEIQIARSGSTINSGE